MIEIERKFKLNPTYTLSDIGITSSTECYAMSCVYLDWSTDHTTRVRFEQNCHDMSYKCIKTVKHTISNITRTEVETEIDFDSDGILLFNQCNVPLSKKRYILPYSNDDSLSWEVDVYDSKNIEDIIIEIEIPSEDYPLVLPQWVGEEITHDPSYSNLQLFLSENSHILY